MRTWKRKMKKMNEKYLTIAQSHQLHFLSRNHSYSASSLVFPFPFPPSPSPSASPVPKSALKAAFHTEV